MDEEAVGKYRFEIKHEIIGHAADTDVLLEGNMLNRIIRATSSGLEHGCDHRHAEVMIQELELAGARTLTSSGVDDTVKKNSKADADSLHSWNPRRHPLTEHWLRGVTTSRLTRMMDTVRH